MEPDRRVCRDHPRVPLQAGVHVNYAESVLRMKDGLPKLKDFPAELGGTAKASPSKRSGNSPRASFLRCVRRAIQRGGM